MKSKDILNIAALAALIVGAIVIMNLPVVSDLVEYTARSTR